VTQIVGVAALIEIVPDTMCECCLSAFAVTTVVLGVENPADNSGPDSWEVCWRCAQEGSAS
jgi:hypothetical protein